MRFSWDIAPYVESIREYMRKALSSPEDALAFLGILSNISSVDSDEGEKSECDCVDRVSAVIAANPKLAMNIRWVKQSIKKKIDLVTKKMHNISACWYEGEEMSCCSCGSFYACRDLSCVVWTTIVIIRRNRRRTRRPPGSQFL